MSRMDLGAAGFSHSPFMRFLGLEIIRAEKGRVEIRLPFREEFLRVDGSDWLHGGVVSALADIAGDYAVITETAPGVPTIDMRVDYLRPARRGDLTAVGEDGAGGQDGQRGRRGDPRLDGHAGRGGPRVLRFAATRRRRTTMSTPMPPDNLNEIGVLKRREIEARILMPVLEALGAEFGREQVFETARRVIIDVARAQGKELAGRMGGDSLGHFATALEDWKKGDAYRMDVLEQTEEKFSFNVTRCRYAEMYRALGIPEVGALLSCNRDFSLVEGFNPAVKLTRTQTVMEGATHCDFRFELEPKDAAPAVKKST